MPGGRLLQPQVLDDLRDVAGGLDVVEGALDLALLVDDHGGADDAGDGLAVELLLAEGAVGLEDLLVGVAEEGDLQGFLLAELGELLGLVGGEMPMTS
ncbi:hypothetical protein GCM10020000_50890 [Streptomyces olivoverticillatus]